MTKVSLGIFQISLLIVVGSALFLSTIVMSYQQAPTTQSTQGTQPTVKITSPKSGESVSASGNLTIIGTSSDTGTSSCQVSVIVNDVKPYQAAAATGSGGANDYSQWKFTVTPNYTEIKEGENKITSRVMCPGTGVELTKWFGINVTGVTGAAAVSANSSSGSQTGNASNQSSGPLYSYSQKQAENKKASDSGKTQDTAAKEEIKNKKENQTQSGQSESTVTIPPSNNETGTNFVPPFSP